MIILKELWILAKTGFIEKEKRNLSQTLTFILKVFAIMIILKLLSIGLLYLLDYANIYKKPSHIGFNKIQDFSLLKKILIIVVYAPIMEELGFRIGLKISKLNLTIMLMALSLTFLRVMFKIEWFYSISLSLSLSLGVLTFFTIQKLEIIDLIKGIWSKNRRLVLYSLLFVFAFMHLKNYEITSELILFSPIVVLPRIIGGFIFSYIRLKSGIALAILLHSFNNFLPFAISYF